MEKLYCVHCRQTYSVTPEAIRLVQQSGKRLVKDGETYRFEEGCFFKTLTLLKRTRSNK